MKDPDWTFLSNYAHVLVCLAENPEARLRDVAERVGITERSAQRLITHLIYLSEQQKRTDRVLLDMPKSQLACLLGTSPENLSRIFAYLTRKGLIRVQGNMIEILRYKDLLRGN